MLYGALARRYAQALFEIASETSLDQVDKELRELARLIEEQQEVARVLYHPHISLAEKKALMEKLIGGETGPIVLNFLYLLIDRRRQDILPLVEREFARMADEARNIVEAKVASAVELSSEQAERLKQQIGRQTGKTVRMVSELRPELIGGILVQVGDRVMDGTIRQALTRMREELRKTSMEEPQGIGVK